MGNEFSSDVDYLAELGIVWAELEKSFKGAWESFSGQGEGAFISDYSYAEKTGSCVNAKGEA